MISNGLWSMRSPWTRLILLRTRSLDVKLLRVTGGLIFWMLADRSTRRMWPGIAMRKCRRGGVLNWVRQTNAWTCRVSAI